MKINEFADLDSYKKSLKDISINKSDPNLTIYLTDSQLDAISFDDVKDEYVKSMNICEVPCSNDALFYDTSSKIYYFIEFKGGKIDSLKNHKLKLKIYDSLLIYLDLLEKTISDTRKDMEYILVYDESKEHSSNNFTCESSTNIKKHLGKLSNDEYIQFGLARYKNFLFKDVHTYNLNDFQKNFIEHFDKKY